MKLILIANIFLQMIDVTPMGLWICRPYGVMDMPPLRYGYDTPTGLRTGGIMELTGLLLIWHPYGVMDMPPR